MNAKLSQEIDFSAIVLAGKKIFPNYFTLKINLITATDNASHQNIAMQRIMVFINEIFDGSVFCNIKNTNYLKFSKMVGDSRVILIPDEPYDQIIGMILFNKINAIVEGKFEIENITIGSDFAPGLIYIIEDFENFSFDEAKIEIPWWNRSDPSSSDIPKQLKLEPSWLDLNLDWEEENSDSPYEIEKHFDLVILDGGPEHDKEK
jgi:hypothetical protein